MPLHVPHRSISDRAAHSRQRLPLGQLPNPIRENTRIVRRVQYEPLTPSVIASAAPSNRVVMHGSRAACASNTTRLHGS
jgi:hypothetical protein